MDLAAVVKRYRELVGGFDRPLHLAQFGLPKAEVERLFSAWDEDYQISRFMLFSRQSDAGELQVFTLHDEEVTHVTFRQRIEQIVNPS